MNLFEILGYTAVVQRGPTWQILAHSEGWSREKETADTHLDVVV